MSSCSAKGAKKEGNMKWWQLSLVGIGCTIGTGYFLGSSIGIRLTGPAIILSFLIAAFSTYMVYNRLAKMTAEDPQEGSFCYYARKAHGHGVGFGCGWNYWCSNILIMGSQLTALSILTRFWFPDVPLWVFTSIYAVLSIIVVLTGTSGFNKLENLFAVIKVAAIVMFIILAIAVLFGWIGKHTGGFQEHDAFFTSGLKGFWASLIYAFYAFGGIEVIGLMAMQLKKKEDAPKAGTMMLLLLAIIYAVSIGLAVMMTSLQHFTEDESPFVTALNDDGLAFFPHVFNAAVIIAGFSAMTASLFGVTNLLVTLAKDKDAPAFFEKKIKKLKDLPLPSLGLATVGLIASIIASFAVPGRIYEYITTAAGLMILYNWFFIITSSLRLISASLFQKILSWLGLLLILAAVVGTLFEKTVRPGLYVSLLFVVVIAIVAFFIQKKGKQNKTAS